MIRIFVDSASDYTLEELTAHQLELFPIEVTIGETTYQDGVNLGRDDLYLMLEQGCPMPTTSQPSLQGFLDAFTQAKEQGDELIYLTLSSALSGTYQNACMAKDYVDYDGIFVVDSLTASYPIKVMADYAAALREQGRTAHEIVQEIEELKLRVRVIAIPDTLEYLYRGGRLSRASATIGALVNIKPIITVNHEGAIVVLSKCIGMGKAQSYVIKYLTEHAPDPNFPLYSIYSYGTTNCTKMEEKLTQAGIPMTERLQIGPTIGTHIGAEAFGIVYVTST